ncbi:MAG: MarC family protein [Sedimentisphaerales bacterium]|nr:MarC family protein [Sedimentisphaerales bacterium]
MWQNILLAFIPVFVAVDAVGVLPIFVSLTVRMTREERGKTIVQSMGTALVLAIGFVFLGKGIFKVLGITVGDFMIAGGAILFCLAITDILSPVKRRRIPGENLGAVPIGTPLIVGPAVLTTCVLAISEYGLLATLISVVANVLLAGLIFSFSQLLIKVLGEAGTKALSKVMSLLLAAIAAMLIRKGLASMLGKA